MDLSQGGGRARGLSLLCHYSQNVLSIARPNVAAARAWPRGISILISVPMPSKPLERGWITNIQIEACRVAITRNMKRKGKLWIRIFPDKSVTARPPETRMGKGKGQPEYWVAVVKPGNIMFEMDGIPEATAKESFRLAAGKLPIRTRFITRAGRYGL